MRRATVWFLALLGGAVSLRALGAAQESGGTPRFLLWVGAVACVVAAWGTAVRMASAHKVVWPLVTITVSVVSAFVVFVVRS